MEVDHHAVEEAHGGEGVALGVMDRVCAHDDMYVVE